MSAFDPKRHFATVNCRIAKGSFNHVVGEGKHVGSHLDAERSRRVQVDDEREFGRSGNLARRTFNRHRYFWSKQAPVAAIGGVLI
jgi:hypothetical protein